MSISRQIGHNDSIQYMKFWSKPYECPVETIPTVDSSFPELWEWATLKTTLKDLKVGKTNLKLILE